MGAPKRVAPRRYAGRTNKESASRRGVIVVNWRPAYGDVAADDGEEDAEILPFLPRSDDDGGPSGAPLFAGLPQRAGRAADTVGEAPVRDPDLDPKPEPIREPEPED
ncbi:MAG: hypothetical protein AAFW98_14835 [Pseudomonadota bacterium]